ncbi:MAG: hypothetical protein AB1454_15005 [Candidatus Auribacterota bacterium]
MMRKFVFVLVIITVAILGFYRLFVMDIYYPQNINVAPMADLKITTVLKTIYDISCDEVYFKNGFNYKFNYKIFSYRKDKLKECLTISTNEKNGFNEAHLYLYETPNNALKHYSSTKSWEEKMIQTDQKITQYNQYYVTYIEHARYAEGFYLPTEYNSYVVFLKQNLVVQFSQNSHYSKDVKNKEKLIRTVATLIQEQVKKQASQPAVSSSK